ncbi:hypothetical protein QTI17_31390 [Variovorax sp. J31P179]|uniref:hypothetical protein n=1 Tax=Variovorax sp. J31P179 TaxID=3053508 RepID=UPI0025756C8C|nr:hypothetical protein [Variovorax sp. J31P179]MDM0085100.1 hypothetical protein [Variovorax sp. J31P179]
MEDAYTAARDVQRILVQLKSNPDTIRSALENWARFAAIDLVAVQNKELQAYLYVQKGQLEQKAASAQGTESSDLTDKANRIQTYASRAIGDLGRWKLGEFPTRLRRLLDEAPDLLPSQREVLAADFYKAVSELQCLVDDLDYHDHDYWREISEKRG